MPFPSWLTSFIGFGWIRDLLGIRKDLIDTKKSKLEVKKLEDDERARNLITPATVDDVKQFDPKYRAISVKIENSDYYDLKTIPPPSPPIWQRVLGIVFWLIVLLGVVGLIIDLVRYVQQ